MDRPFVARPKFRDLFGSSEPESFSKLADCRWVGLSDGMNSPLRTPLHEFHREHGARFVDFAGWEMPVQYKSILEEHKAVRSAAGLFDVSHMGEILVSGPEAGTFLNRLVTNDVSRISPGRVVYTPMCRPDGGVVDDLLISNLGAEGYLLCVNAANRAKDLTWIRRQSTSFSCTVEDLSDQYGLLALQGPASDPILHNLANVDLSALPYYRFVEGEVAGIPCLISRTGYTGERGVELFCASGEADALARAILNSGEPHGLILAGLGARDSLRLEAGFSLYGHEISDTISPVEAKLLWTVKFDKGEFFGREALLAQREDGTDATIVFFRTGERRIVRTGSPVLAGDEIVGTVVSGTLSPILNEAIGSMHVKTAVLDQELAVDLRGKRTVLQPVKPPFLPLKK